MKLQNKNNGFSIIEVILVVLVVGALGFVGYRVFMGNKNSNPQDEGMTQLPSEEEPMSDVKWETTSEGGWMALGTPPDCPDPFPVQSPSPQLDKATAVLYPGQERQGQLFDGAGGNYKPHAGFRFDNSANDEITVVSPIDGYVHRGSQYLTGGEIQYTFDIIHPCGMMVRVGHLLSLSEPFQTMADAFPPAVEGDSRTERVASNPPVKAGDLIGTSVGLANDKNVFFDTGMYDLRKTNEASQSPDYQTKHTDNKELAWYAICWFDLLPSADSAFVYGLPAADPMSGSNSDYCN